MEAIRIGRIGRALRQRLGLRQRDLGARVGLSQGEVSLFERGRIEQMPIRTVRRILGGVDAELILIVRWRGGDLDRLLDAAHARLADDLTRLLAAGGWDVAPEVTYSVYGERGSIDLVAWQSDCATLIVVEIKTEIASIEETLRKHDEKVRLAGRLVHERFGWKPASVARLLVMPEHRTIRHQIEAKSALFDRAYPMRNVAVRRWLRAPAGPTIGMAGMAALPGMAGILFLPDTNLGRVGRTRPQRKRVRVVNQVRIASSGPEVVPEIGPIDVRQGFGGSGSQKLAQHE